MKLPIMFFTGSLRTTAAHLLVFPRKSWKNIGGYWNSTVQRTSHGILIPVLQKELEQNNMK
jgi:hypothetical protein